MTDKDWAMSQPAKGGKWVIGWCVVEPSGVIQIPPFPYAEYGFQISNFCR
jgi:hypothetical protein